MPVEPHTPTPDDSHLALGGFSVDSPPFAYSVPTETPVIATQLLHNAVDLMTSFIESENPCWSRDYAAVCDERKANKVANIATNALRSVAPKGVTVVRRAAQVYILRK